MGSFTRNSRGGGSSFGRRDFGARSGDRPMFKTTCNNCGKECEVPFRPTTGKPVYCSDCFEKMGGRRSDSRRPERSDFRAPAPSFDQNKAQFDALNAKIDRILGLLEPKVGETGVSVPVVEELMAEEVKTPKTKKEAKKSTSPKKKLGILN
jgi:CxxC-x17-CxxC domain-containing protein